MPSGPQWTMRLPRKRDRELIAELKAEAARQELSAAALCRWILRAVLHGQHPARVRARLIATRKTQPAPGGSGPGEPT
jgi:hypothetical protein